jgi:hypothetical protein
MKKSHVCRERGGFELCLQKYPHIIYRCGGCQAPTRAIPVDDLQGSELDLALELIRRFRINGGGFDGETGA